MNKGKNISIMILVILIASSWTLSSCSENPGSGLGVPAKAVTSEDDYEFTEFENKLSEIGVSFIKSDQKDNANLLSAICGARYDISDGYAEVYKFKIDNEVYVNSFNEQRITMTRDSKSIVYPVFALDGIVVIINDIEDLKTVQSFMWAVSKQWH